MSDEPYALDFRRLKLLVSIERVLAAHGVLAMMRRDNHRLMGPCPIHQGDSPRAFVVDLERNIWYCFTGCARGGDVVDLVRALDRVDFRGAAVRLASLAQAGWDAPALLHHGPPASGSSERPFTPYTRELRLNPNTPWLRAKGIQTECASEHEVGAYLGRGWLAGCVGVRLRTPEGQPVGYAGRHLDPTDAARLGKWRFPPGLPKKELLYNYHRARPRWACGVVVVECPWGVLRLAQLGVPAVSLLGVSLSSAQRALLVEAPRVILLLDGDRAGRSAGPILQAALTGTEVRIVELPDGCDPDDLSDAALAAVLKKPAGA